MVFVILSAVNDIELIEKTGFSDLARMENNANLFNFQLKLADC